MTRFLSLVILFLHFLSDIRRKVTLPTTAALLAFTATFAIASTVAGGLMKANYGSQQNINQLTKIAHPEPRRTTSLSLLVKRQSARTPALPSSRTVVLNKVMDNATLTQNGPVVNSFSTPQVTNMSGTQEGNPDKQQLIGQPQASSLKPTTNIQLSQSQTVCKQGQHFLSIMSAQVLLQKPQGIDLTMTWYWETRIDSGDTTATPLVPPTQNTQQINAGQPSVLLTATDTSQPLLVAPMSANYAYSLRLHVLLNMDDTTSDWVNIAQDQTTCPS